MAWSQADASLSVLSGSWGRRLARSVLGWCSRRAVRLAHAREPGVTKVSFHPAAGEGLPRPDFESWSGYRCRDELGALMHPGVAAEVESQQVKLISFAAL